MKKEALADRAIGMPGELLRAVEPAEQAVGRHLTPAAHLFHHVTGIGEPLLSKPPSCP